MATTILSGKRIVLGVCGSIAAYKVANLARSLTLAGAIVDVIMTEAAQRFVGSATFQALTGRAVLTDMWQLPEDGVVGHVSLAMHADMVVVAPATANTLARIAAGICDDLLTTVVLATTAPVLCVPAMNVQMYAAAATQHNIATLRQRGFYILEPTTGRMAEPMEGKGRLPEPTTIEGEICAVLGKQHGALRGKRVVVTAGGTREPIDPVRYIGNRSSGTMGVMLATAARNMGADVTLISGAMSVPVPAAVAHQHVETAIEMQQAVYAAIDNADVLIMNAAVADFRPAHYANTKIKKHEQGGLTIELVPNPDILFAMDAPPRLYVVGFAAETNDLLANASSKLARKRLHMIVANDAETSIGTTDIAVTLLYADGTQNALPRQTKTTAAEAILHAIAAQLTQK